MALVPPALSAEEPIPLHIAADKAYVYDVDAIRRLRVDHHITGITLGTLPQVAQQNVFLGVPLQLLPEEVAVLVQERIACLVDDGLAHAHPTPDQAAEYARARKKAISAQQDYALAQEEEKARAMKEKYKDQIEKRQRERLAKREKQKVAEMEAAAHGSQGILPAEAANEGEPTPPGEQGAPAVGEAAPKDSSRMGYSIVTATTSDGRAWYHPDPLSSEVDPYQCSLSIPPKNAPTRSTFFLLDSANHFSKSTTSPQDAAIINITKQGHGLLNTGQNWLSDGSGSSSTSRTSGDLDSIKLKNARIEVFRDLWKQGYFMGSGLKFGADFLVYPGDPLRFHSHFVCTVLLSPLADIAPLDLVAWGRLATAVKKSHLIASWDEKKRKVNYLSLEWAGFG